MFSSQSCLPPAVLLFSIFLYLFCFHFAGGTQNACHDLLTGASRIRAMLHNEHTDQFYLLTSSGHIFIEPISNFDHASSPPSLTLTEAKYSMPTEWHLNNRPHTIKGDNEEFLTFWVNPDNHRETLLNLVSQDQSQICAYPGVKLDQERAQVEKVTGICTSKLDKTSPDFWLGFNSQSYGMVKATQFYCRIYYFPDSKTDILLKSSNTWKSNSECLGLFMEGKPQCGVVHKEGNVAVVVQDTSTVYVYRGLITDAHLYGLNSGSKNHLTEKKHVLLRRPTSHQINEFIKCAESKAEDVASNVEQPGVNQPKPGNPSEPILDTPMMRKLLLIIPGVLLLVGIILGLVVKFKLVQAFPWNRKGKAHLISQAYSVAISKASVVSREGTLQRILKQKGKLPKKADNKKLATPGAVTKMLEKIKRKLFNSVKVAKKHNKKKIKKKKKKKGR